MERGHARFISAAQLDAAFLWEAIQAVAARTATIKFQGNVYETAPSCGQPVTIRYSLSHRIEVFHRGASHGHAQPRTISRHCHPKVKQAPQVVPAVTGIDYLQLLGHPLAGLSSAGGREGLAESAAKVPEVFDEPPGGTVGVEVAVVGEAGQLVEDVAGACSSQSSGISA